jgi:excinuclease UvrABC helicase subunit UvrB
LSTENEKKTQENDVNIETSNEQKRDSSEMNERENKSKRLQECRTLLNHLEEHLAKACEREDYETAGLCLFVFLVSLQIH